MMRNVLAKLLMLVGTVALNACSTWQGPPFYTVSESVDPLPLGVYRFVDNGKTTDSRWDGTRFTEIGKGPETESDVPPDLVAVPLALPNYNLYLVQATYHSDRDGKKPTEAEYFLLRGEGDQFLLAMPDCAATKAIVRKAGGVVQTLPNKTIENPSGLVCHFPTRTSLEAAARRYATEPKLPGVQFTRIGD